MCSQEASPPNISPPDLSRVEELAILDLVVG